MYSLHHAETSSTSLLTYKLASPDPPQSSPPRDLVKQLLQLSRKTLQKLESTPFDYRNLIFAERLRLCAIFAPLLYALSHHQIQVPLPTQLNVDGEHADEKIDDEAQKLVTSLTLLIDSLLIKINPEPLSRFPPTSPSPVPPAPSQAPFLPVSSSRHRRYIHARYLDDDGVPIPIYSTSMSSTAVFAPLVLPLLPSPSPSPSPSIPHVPSQPLLTKRHIYAKWRDRDGVSIPIYSTDIIMATVPEEPPQQADFRQVLQREARRLSDVFQHIILNFKPGVLPAAQHIFDHEAETVDDLAIARALTETIGSGTLAPIGRRRTEPMIAIRPREGGGKWMRRLSDVRRELYRVDSGLAFIIGS